MDFLDKLAGTRPSNVQIQDQRERANQQPEIAGAQDSAEAAQGTADAALLQPPIGTMTGWAGSGDPVGGKWMVCDGRLLNQSDYPALYAVCGATWSIGGEGAGQFRIPDMRSRVQVGAGQGSALTNRTSGSKFGEEAHVLTWNEMPSHGHGGSVTDLSNHSHGGSADSQSHNHNYQYASSHESFALTGGGAGFVDQINYSTVATSQAAHGHNIATDTNSHGHSISDLVHNGADAPHQNMQPSLVMNFILRVL